MLACWYLAFDAKDSISDCFRFWDIIGLRQGDISGAFFGGVYGMILGDIIAKFSPGPTDRCTWGDRRFIGGDWRVLDGSAGESLAGRTLLDDMPCDELP